MKIKQEIKGNVLIISIEGRLDTTNYQELESIVNQQLDNNNKFLVFNCETLQYISSSGLRVFLFSLKRIGQMKGKLVICGLNSNLTEIFSIAGFANYFHLAKDEKEALAAF